MQSILRDLGLSPVMSDIVLNGVPDWFSTEIKCGFYRHDIQCETTHYVPPVITHDYLQCTFVNKPSRNILLETTYQTTPKITLRPLSVQV